MQPVQLPCNHVLLLSGFEGIVHLTSGHVGGFFLFVCLVFFPLSPFFFNVTEAKV